MKPMSRPVRNQSPTSSLARLLLRSMISF